MKLKSKKAIEKNETKQERIKPCLLEIRYYSQEYTQTFGKVVSAYKWLHKHKQLWRDHIKECTWNCQMQKNRIMLP